MIPLAQANKLLNVVLSQSSPNEATIALGKVVDYLVENGFGPNDVQFIARDESLARRVIDLTAELDLMARQKDTLANLLIEKQHEIDALHRKHAVQSDGKRYVTGLEKRINDLQQELSGLQEQQTKEPRPSSRHILTESVERPELLSDKNLVILKGLHALQEATIRQLSLHLYNEPDTNTVLDDAMKTLRARGLVDRKPIDRTVKGFGNSRWLYFLTDQGFATLKNIAL